MQLTHLQNETKCDKIPTFNQRFQLYSVNILFLPQKCIWDSVTASSQINQQEKLNSRSNTKNPREIFCLFEFSTTAHSKVWSRKLFIAIT
jgi:hypothetical protein